MNWRIIIPEWIAYYEEHNVDFVAAGQDIVTAGLDQFAVRLDDGAAIESFLLVVHSISPSAKII